MKNIDINKSKLGTYIVFRYDNNFEIMHNQTARYNEHEFVLLKDYIRQIARNRDDILNVSYHGLDKQEKKELEKIVSEGEL